MAKGFSFKEVDRIPDEWVKYVGRSGGDLIVGAFFEGNLVGLVFGSVIQPKKLDKKSFLVPCREKPACFSGQMNRGNW